MSRYKRGDVILVYFPFKDKLETKPRPAVVLDVDQDEYSICIQCTSKNRSKQMPGIWVLQKSKEGDLMGLLLDSFINVTVQVKLDKWSIIRKIGVCPFMEDIDKILIEHKPI